MYVFWKVWVFKVCEKVKKVVFDWEHTKNDS